MGVPRKDLPHWDDLQIMAAKMATKPLLDDAAVGTVAHRSADRHRSSNTNGAATTLATVDFMGRSLGASTTPVTAAGW